MYLTKPRVSHIEPDLEPFVDSVGSPTEGGDVDPNNELANVRGAQRHAVAISRADRPASRSDANG
jgi:hypothetical protein